MATGLIGDAPSAGLRAGSVDNAAWARKLPRLKARMRQTPAGSIVKCLDYRVRINDGPNYYILFKDLFVHQVYQFAADRADPLILDCGSNVGLSVLYFKHIYPQSRIVAFEPDPTIFPLLAENVTINRLTGVELHQTAVAGRAGMLTLASDSRYASCLADYLSADGTQRPQQFSVPSVRLSDYLAEPVDYLKLNIEGAECDVILESEARLRQVREMVIEYHHLPGLPRTLHTILQVLHRQGFEYLIHDFDRETNPGSGPPFRLNPCTSYFLLVYARRTERESHEPAR